MAERSRWTTVQGVDWWSLPAKQIMRGLANRLVIVSYDPQWPALYEGERDAIRRAIGDRLVATEHVGSTAVPNLGAKPIVDVMGALPRLADAEACIAPLAAIGYHFVPEAMHDLPDDRYFERWTEGYEQGRELAHLHLTAHGSAFWRDHLLFRDFLRAHPQTAREYEDLKRQLAPRHLSGATYAPAKGEFIQAVLAEARQWAEMDSARGL